MTDRELLEKAAKAAGITLSTWHQKPARTYESCGHRFTKFWNPLTDDGDALRLAVTLGMHIRFYRKHVDVDAEAFSLVDSVVSESFTGAHKAEATRRAIVRAAAALTPDGADPHA